MLNTFLNTDYTELAFIEFKQNTSGHFDIESTRIR